MGSFLEILNNLGPKRIFMIGGAFALTIGLIIAMASGLGGGNSTRGYSPLFTSVTPADGAKIIQALDGMAVPYEVRANGTQIYVPGDQVSTLRLKLAGEGIGSGSVGYEVFDQEKGIGTSNFVYNINLIRATEGELARTIGGMTGVDSARVHLVMPKREVFSREFMEPSASISLKLNPGSQLSKQNVEAIRQLVATSVPGLKHKRITIVDNRGRLLARGSEDANEGGYESATADEYKTSTEMRLTNTIEEMVERTVGPGRVKARVTADIDFDKTVINSESYDPEGQVARSIQTTEEKNQDTETSAENNVTVQNNLPTPANGGGGGAGNGSSSNTQKNEEITNFEISKTVKNHVKESGSIKKLSVAVLLDGSMIKDEKTEKEVYTPRSAEEIKKIEALVKSAIGFDEARGDKIEVINMPFSESFTQNLKDTPIEWIRGDIANIMQTLIIGVVVVLAILLVIKPLVTRILEVTIPKPIAESGDIGIGGLDGNGQYALDGPGMAGQLSYQGGGSGGNIEESEETLIDVDRVKGKIKSSSMKKISALVDRNPDEAMNTIRRWIKQDAEG